MKYICHFLLVMVLCPLGAAAQLPGEVDTSFHTGSFTYGSVMQIEKLPDGKYIIAGNFSNWHHTPVTHMARLNSDFSLDTGFAVTTGFYSVSLLDISEMIVQPDGKILLLGNFTKFNGINRKYILRLNSDGTLDMSFNPGATFNSRPFCMDLQSDGKILLGGGFTNAFGVTHNHLLRLNSDGTLDTGFSSDAAVSNGIYDMLVQADGKIVICGNFYTEDVYKRIVRLLPDGSVDTDFTSALGDGPNNAVYAITQQADNKIIAAGNFTSFGGLDTKHFARIHTDGSIDNTLHFSDNLVLSVSDPFKVQTAPNGDVVFSGEFYIGNYLNSTRDLIRISSDGTLLQTFTHISNSYYPIYDFTFDADEHIIAVNTFLLNDQVCNGLASIQPDGTPDPSIMPYSGFAGYALKVIAEQPDGKILTGGEVTHYHDGNIGQFVRLNSDGTRDTGFSPVAVTGDAGMDIHVVHDIALLPDGSMYVCGNFTGFGGYTRKRIVKLFPDGTVDPSFGAFTGANKVAYGVSVQPDGKIILGGNFTYYNGTPCEKAIRLLPNGERDPSFAIADMPLYPFDFEVLPDGKILMWGEFMDYDGSGKNGLVRLHSDGSHDLTFNAGMAGPNNDVIDLRIDAEGRYIIVGNFTTYNGTARSRIARLLPDGSLDMDFDPGSGFTGFTTITRAIVTLPDLSMIIGGSMTQYNGAPVQGLVHINPDGSLNTDLSPALAGNIHCALLCADGKLLAGGDFDVFNTSTVNKLVKVQGVDIPCAAPTDVYVDGITGTKATVHWETVTGADLYDIWYRQVGATGWTKKTSGTNSKTLKSLSPGTEYEYKLRTKCTDGETSAFTGISTFSTLRTEAETKENTFVCYPNPAENALYIETTEKGMVHIYNITGALQLEATLDEDLLVLDISNLANGLYFVTLLFQEHSSTISITINH